MRPIEHVGRLAGIAILIVGMALVLGLSSRRHLKHYTIYSLAMTPTLTVGHRVSVDLSARKPTTTSIVVPPGEYFLLGIGAGPRMTAASGVPSLAPILSGR